MENLEQTVENSLKIKALTAIRGYNLLFSGLNFELCTGQFAALQGPNGTGKSTLLRMIAGLSTPEAGTISRPLEPKEAGPFYLGHLDGLRANDTPEEHLKYWAKLHGRNTSQTDEALSTVGLSARRDVPAYALSAGQKKRIALARAVIAPRKLWLLDEPAAALDRAGQALLCDLIRSHTDSGGLCLAALHDPLELEPDLTLNLTEFMS